jgi:hypothetical protein
MQSEPKTMVYTVDIGNGQVADIEGPEGATPEQLQQAYTAQNAAPANDAHPAALDTSGTQYQAGFSDELGAQPVSKLAPEDEAHLVSLLRAGHDDLATQFAASKGFDISNAAAIKQARDQTGAVNPDTAYTLPDVKALDTGGGGGAMTRGILDTATLGLAPKLGAAARAVTDNLSGNGHGLVADYNRERDIGTGVREQDQTEHPWLKLSGELFGGLVLPAGLEGVGLKAGSDVLRAGGSMADARAAAAVAVRNRAAVVGGEYGAAHGALSADGPQDAVTGALTEGALGAATGLGLGALGQRLGNRPAPAVTDGQQVAAAAGRQGIDVLPADVGGPMTRRLTSAAAQAPISASPIINASARVVDQAQGARDRIAATVGQALDPETAGQTALAGAQKYIANSRATKNALYDAAEKAAGDARVTPTKALDALQSNIDELSQTPGGAPGLAHLEGLKDALSQGDFSVNGIRNMRTVMRDQFIKDGLRGSDLERRVGQVLDAAKDDVTDSLAANGKQGAAALYSKADAFYRDRANTIDNVLTPLIGTRDKPRSGEQIIKSLTADMQGNNARSVKFLRSLPPEEQANTRASIIGSLGRTAAGAQNVDGNAFSLPVFLTHWNKIGETAKNAYFGVEARAALNDLAKVAEGTKAAQGYANRSNTAGGIWGNLGVLAGSAAASPVAATTGLATQLITGHLLASPAFARWLARAPRTALSAPAYIDRLSRVARAEPQIANEVLQLQQRLTDAFTSSPTRLAAQPAGNEAGNTQGGASQQQSEQQGFQP